MLQRRIDIASIPHGLAVLEEDVVKGMAVCTKFVDGREVAFLPTNEEEAGSVLGFATYRIEHQDKSDVDYDTLKAGKKCTIYTLVKNNVWGTTEFEGDLAVGDELVVSFDAETKGKLVAVGASGRTPQFEVVRVQAAGTIFTSPMIDVRVL